MVGVYVTIITDEGVFKHWAIFIDEPHEADKIMLQAMVDFAMSLNTEMLGV